MSLTTFHLVFITAAIALALSCGGWWLTEFIRGVAGLPGLLSGSLAVAAGVALIFYERYFVHKVRKLAKGSEH